MKTLLAPLAALTLILVSHQAEAMKITVVKNGKALLDLEGESVRVGEQFIAINEEGKKKGLLTIKQVKGNKAIAGIDKGQAQAGYVLESRSQQQSSSPRGKSKGAWGVTAGYAMNTMSAKPTGGTVDMKGSSFSLLGFYQMDLEKNIGVKLSAGYQTLVANGTASSAICTGSTDCNVNISYLGLNALVRYTFVHGKTMDFWGGAGLGFLFALSKSSTVLDTSKVSTNQTILGSLGLDYHISRSNFIPVEFQYSMFPNNSTSSASQMILTAGYGWDF